MNNKMPLTPSLCPKTIQDYVMIDRIMKILDDPKVSQEIKDIAIMGLELALQAHNETNPTLN